MKLPTFNLVMAGSPRRGDRGRLGEPSLPPMESAWSVAGQAKTEIRKPVAQSAFTMIEIALALGVIGFALVAIIGILPAGLNVQRLAREDTLIAQDGPFLMQAIRNGAPAVLTNGEYQVIGGPSVSVGGATSLDFLTNYVDQITTTFITGNSTTVVNYAGAFTNGAAILGLLSRPDFPGTNVVTTAKMRGFSGGATEQNGSNAVIAFRYYMDVEVTPFSTYSEAALDQDNNGQFTKHCPSTRTSITSD